MSRRLYGDHYYSTPDSAISMLKFIRRILRPARAFVTMILFRATPMRLHFLLFKMPRGICCASDFTRISLGEVGKTSASTPRIVGGPRAAEKSPVIRLKFITPKSTAQTFVLCIEGGHSTRLGMNLSADGRLISDASYET